MTKEKVGVVLWANLSLPIKILKAKYTTQTNFSTP
jgi:hypothetical protein